MAPPALKPTTKPSRGYHFASQVIHGASKLHLMAPHHLCRIGKSPDFHEILVNVSREANKYLRPALERAVKACDEGENETDKARKHRKRLLEARIAEKNKRYKRTVARNKADITEYVRREWFGGPPSAMEEANDAELDAATTIANSTSTMISSAQGEQVKLANRDVSDDEKTPEEGEETKPNIEPTKYDRQLALVRGEPLYIDKSYCRIDLARMYTGSRGDFNVNAEFEEVLQNCVMKLEPEAVRDDLVEYLRNRLETAGTINPLMASDTSSIEEILEVLHVLNRLSEDAMIRCAAAQILLYFSVQRQVSENPHVPVCKHRTPHLNILQDLAAKKAGHVSQKESMKVYKSNEKDYHAGKKWINIIDMFGDDAVVIIFVVAGIGPWYATNKFTEYQRECLIHISSHLYGVHTLVAALGPKALERYCRRGCLEKEIVDLVETVDVLEA